MAASGQSSSSRAACASIMLLWLALTSQALAESFITKMLAPFADIKSLMKSEGGEFVKLVKDAGEEMRTGQATTAGWQPNGTFVPVDERYPVGADEMRPLLDLYRKCRTRDSLAMQTWCVGDPDEFAADKDRITMCPPGMRTHPCTGRLLPGTWESEAPFDPQEMAKFLWPWESVKCEAYADPTTVTQIYLPGEGLKCSLQDLNLGSMRSLEQLDLSDNKLHGPLPSWLNWRMNSLRFLNLSHNELNGTLQKPFSDCDRIEVLDLSHNQLKATTLAIFGSLRRLRHVNLAHNPLGITLPSRSFQSDVLNYMNLSHCGLHGSFPDFPIFRHLVTMDLSHNNLTGPLPPSLTLLGRHDITDPDEEPVVEIIDISHNRLTGSLPEMWNSTGLRALAVNDNGFSGRIPNLPPNITKLAESAASMFADNGQFWCSMPGGLAQSALPCICGGGFTPLRNWSRFERGLEIGDAGYAYGVMAANGSATANASTTINGTWTALNGTRTAFNTTWTAFDSIWTAVNGSSTAINASSMAVNTSMSALNASLTAFNTSLMPFSASIPFSITSTTLIPARSASKLCLRCPDGTYSNETTGYQCTPCPTGWMPVSSVQSHLPAFLWETQYAELKSRIMDRCGRCPPGSFAGSVDGSNAIECRLCPPGTANSRIGRVECDKCPPGRFSSADGAVTCSPCTPGTFADAEGSKACRPCPTGTFSRWAAHANNSGIAECLPCARGFYQEVSGAPKCLACPEGSVTRLPGMNKCFSCPPGSAFDSKSKSCLPCLPGTFSATEAAKSCSKCPAGTTTETFGSDQCFSTALAGRGFDLVEEQLNASSPTRECRPGTFNGGSSLTCQPCPRGTFAGVAGMKKCSPCPVGSFSPHSRAIRCLEAPIGFFVDEEGAWKPKRCGAGEFMRAAGSSRCNRCPDGSFAVFGSDEGCETPRDGEILQHVEWPRVRMTLLGVTLDDFHARFSTPVNSNALNSSLGSTGTSAAKAISHSVRTALELFAVADVKVHVVSVERASAVEGTADLAVDLAVEKVPLRLPPRGKAADESWTTQFKKMAVRMVSSLTSDSSASGQSAEPSSSTGKAGGGLFSKLLFGDGKDTERDDRDGKDLATTMSSAAFREQMAHNLGRHDALNRSIPLALLQMQMLDANTTWKAIRAVPCPPGSYFSKANRTCELCKPGSYASEPGSPSCSLCPRGTFADDAGMESCEKCEFTEDSREGSTACVYCEWFTRECSDFVEHVVITVVLALALALKVFQRLRAVFYGDRRALQRSEDTVLLSAVRTFGRTVGGVRYAPMGEVSASTLWSPPPTEQREQLLQQERVHRTSS